MQMTWAAECGVNWLGLSFASLLAALPLALTVSWTTIALYRRAVGRAMRSPVAAGAMDPAPPPALPGPPPAALRMVTLPPGTARAHGNGYRHESRVAARRVSTAYAVAGIVHGLLVAILMVVLDGIEFLPIRFLTMWMVYAWPAVPVFALTATGRRRAKRLLVGTYFVVLIAFDAAMAVAGVSDGAGRLVGYWALEMLPPTLLLWMLGNRAMRCVGLLALLVAMAVTTTGFASFQGLGCLALTTRSVALINWILPLQIACVVVVIAAIWWGMRRWATWVSSRGVSDQMITVDSWWLLITAIEMLLMAPGFGAATPLLLLVFVVYKGVSVIGLRWATAGSRRSDPPQLLMLRVFGHARRTERLLDEIGARWRYLGPLNLVAGTDIATSFLDPDELLRFVGGRLGDGYIGDYATLESRLAVDGRRRHTDGRFPLREYFCRDHMWRAVVVRLAAMSDAVAIDLRGFSAANRGCEFELGVLLASVSLRKVTTLIDATTDVEHLERTLQSIWRHAGAGGVNAAEATPTVSVMRAEGHGEALADDLLGRLFGAVGMDAERGVSA